MERFAEVKDTASKNCHLPKPREVGMDSQETALTTLSPSGRCAWKKQRNNPYPYPVSLFYICSEHNLFLLSIMIQRPENSHYTKYKNRVHYSVQQKCLNPTSFSCIRKSRGSSWRLLDFLRLNLGVICWMNKSYSILSQAWLILNPKGNSKLPEVHAKIIPTLEKKAIYSFPSDRINKTLMLHNVDQCSFL